MDAPLTVSCFRLVLCAACHGADGNGGEFAPGFVARIVNRTDLDVATVVTEGLTNLGMPPFKLQQQDVGNLIAYIRTLRLPRRGDLVPVEVTVETTD